LKQAPVCHQALSREIRIYNACTLHQPAAEGNTRFGMMIDDFSTLFSLLPNTFFGIDIEEIPWDPRTANATIALH
jgi:hypothetical protein